MLPISIDISEKILEFNLSRQEADELKKGLLDKLMSNCINELNDLSQELGKTRGQYQNGIRTYKDGDFKGTIELNGQLPNMLEHGCSAFDIKESMLKSSKVKTSAKGDLYMAIPFRVGIPTTVNDNPLFANKMVPALYKKALKLNPGEQIKVIDLPKELQNLGERKRIEQGGKVWESYTHSVPIFTGLTKATTESGYGGYVTFRRISLNSDKNSWIHPGLEARDFFGVAYSRTIDNLDQTISETIDNFLQTLFE